MPVKVGERNMSSGTRTHRAASVGLCGALGVLTPLAAYAVTMPYGAVHEVVAAGAAPFALGAVAGVGALALAVHRQDKRAARKDADASRAGADRDAKGAQDAEEVVPGVPRIVRAPNAMDEAEAWAEIDALLSDDARISCDPEQAQDLYQIALDELSRTQGGVVPGRDDGRAPAASTTAEYIALADAAIPDADQGPSTVPDATSVYLALAARAGEAAEMPAAHDAGDVGKAVAADGPSPVRAPDSTDVYLAAAGERAPAANSEEPVPSGGSSSARSEEDELCEAAREAALVSLYGPEALEADRARAGRQPFEVIGGTAAGGGSDAADVSETEVTSSLGTAAREEVWAQAIAILEEEDGPQEEYVPRPRGAHFASIITVDEVERAMEEQGMDEPESFQYAVAARLATAAPVSDGGGELEPSRVAAVAEGARRTAMHSRVNEMIGEEFDKVPSQSVRRTSREYLRVIDGGTAILSDARDEARMQVEA